MSVLPENDFVSAAPSVFKVTAHGENRSRTKDSNGKDVYGANAILLNKAGGIFVTSAHLGMDLAVPDFYIHLPDNQVCYQANTSKKLANPRHDFRYLWLPFVDLSAYREASLRELKIFEEVNVRLIGQRPFETQERDDSCARFTFHGTGQRLDGEKSIEFKLTAGELACGMCGSALTDEKGRLLGLTVNGEKRKGYAIPIGAFKLDRYFDRQEDAWVPKNSPSLLRRLFSLGQKHCP